LREGFQESLLRGFFNLGAIAEEPVGNMKNPGAESSNNLGERTFVFRACLARQFEF